MIVGGAPVIVVRLLALTPLPMAWTIRVSIIVAAIVSRRWFVLEGVHAICLDEGDSAGLPIMLSCCLAGSRVAGNMHLWRTTVVPPDHLVTRVEDAVVVTVDVFREVVVRVPASGSPELLQCLLLLSVVRRMPLCMLDRAALGD